MKAPHSQSLGNRLNRIALAVAGARTHSNELPKEIQTVANALEKQHGTIQATDVEQEQAKRALTMKTQQVNEAVQLGEQLRMKIVRMAEAQFGPRDPRIREFRPVTQGRTRTSKAKTGQQATGATTSVAALLAPPPAPAAPASPSK